MERPDPDRPTSWVRYRPRLCDGCDAGCCQLPVEVTASDLLRMGLVGPDETQGSLKRVAKRLEREGIVASFRARTGLFTLRQRPARNGKSDCLYLGPDRRCTIYAQRPDVCRHFPTIGPRPGFCPSQQRQQRGQSPFSTER